MEGPSGGQHLSKRRAACPAIRPVAGRALPVDPRAALQRFHVRRFSTPHAKPAPTLLPKPAAPTPYFSLPPVCPVRMALRATAACYGRPRYGCAHGSAAPQVNWAAKIRIRTEQPGRKPSTLVTGRTKYPASIKRHVSYSRFADQTAHRISVWQRTCSALCWNPR
jgi:hypothetical protein